MTTSSHDHGVPSVPPPSIPDTATCRAVEEFARRVSPPFLLHHVMRTHAFAVLAGAHAPAYDPELLYVGCLLHDLGLCESVPVTSRFEVDGADAAKEFLAEQGMDEAKIDIVWDAIALHTTEEIPQRKRPEIALVQTGAAIDVGVVPVDVLDAEAVAMVLDAWPRLGFKKAIVQVLLSRLRSNPAAAASHVVRDIAERHVHGFCSPNVCDVIDGAAFTS